MSATAAQYSPLGSGGGDWWLWCVPCRRWSWRKGGFLCGFIALIAFSVMTVYCSAPDLRQAQAQSHQFICYPIFSGWSKLIQMPRVEQINFGIGSFVGDMKGDTVNPVSSETELDHAEITEAQSIGLGPNPRNETIAGVSRQSPSVENEYQKNLNEIYKTTKINKVSKTYKNGSDLVEPNNPNEILLAQTKPTEIIEVMEIIEEQRKKIEMLNHEQFVLNLDKFGPLTNDSIVIIIQAHKRVGYFKELIRSLEKTKFISETLIVVSHGDFSSQMNDAVKNIKFTRAVQIFFPFSLQTHPNSFPGISLQDCPREYTKEESEKKNCTWSPRNAKEQQLKHHWWWKANFVFNHLRVTRSFNGLVLFLEEDHYEFPDLLHMLKMMRAIAPQECPDCNIFGLGLNPGSVLSYRGLSDKLQVVQWNNMGFAFDREFWRGMSSDKCANMFCEYNDYNWDFTLAYLSHRCLPQELKPLNVHSPRVFHIGDCGMHFHGKDCSAMEALRGTKELEAEVLPYLFPPEVHVTNTGFTQMRVDGRNGGWSDPRDVALCKTFAGIQPPNDVQTN